MDNFGRHLRRESVMSYPTSATSIENNYTHIGVPTLRSSARGLRRRTAFRKTHRLIICGHFIKGFYFRCAGPLTVA